MQVLKFILATTIVFDVAIVVWVMVLSRAKERLARIYFMLFMSLVLWETGLWFGFFFYFSETITVLLDQFIFSIGAVAICISLHFLWELVGRLFIPKAILYGYSVMIAILAVILWIPGLLIKGREYVDTQPYAYFLDYGPLFIPYHLLLAPALVGLIYLFVRGNVFLKGLRLTRLRFVGVGLLLAVGLPIVLAIWEPLFHYLKTGNFRVGGEQWLIIAQTISAITVSFFTLLSGYAITRYRFMDIKVMLQKSVVYGVTIVLTTAMYMGVMYLFYRLIGSAIALFLGFALLVFILDPIKKRIKIWLDSLFFLEELELSKKLSERAAKINTTHDLETFVNESVKTIEEKLKVTALGFYVRQREHHRYFCFYPKNGVAHLYMKDDITQHLLNAEDISITEELKLNGYPKTKQLLKALEKRNAGGLLQIKTDNTVNGLILFSRKKNGKSFTHRDFRFIEKQIEKTQSHLAHLIFWHETLVGNQIILNEREYQQH